MRYLVYGAGAVGGYLGGSLAPAGYPVAFFDRPEVAESLRATGLTLEASGTSRRIEALTLVNRLDRLPTPPDVVLLTVKAYDCAAAPSKCGGTAPTVPVVCVLNGIGNEATLARRSALSGSSPPADLRHPAPDSACCASRRPQDRPGIDARLRPG
jgi:2-dehydropantoate 2-reductase